MYFLDFGDFEIAGASPEPLITVAGRQRLDAPDRRDPAPRRERRGGPADGRGAARRPEGARRARDARRPRPQRPRPGVRVRQRRGRGLHGGRELQPRDAHRLERHRDAAPGRRRARRAALGAARRARCPARPRSGRCRSSTSSSRSSAAATAARSATSATRATSTPASTSARSSSRTASPTSRPGGGTVADAKPDYEFRESEAKARAVLQAIELAVAPAGVAMRVLVLDNYDSFTYNLVQYLGELGAEIEVVRNDHATVDELLVRGYDRVIVSPGPCTPDEAGISLEAVRRFPPAEDPDARRLPRPSGARAGVGRQGDPARAGARQDDQDRARRPDDLPRPARAARGRSLPLAGRRPRAARRARAQRRPPRRS